MQLRYFGKRFKWFHYQRTTAKEREQFINNSAAKWQKEETAEVVAQINSAEVQAQIEADEETAYQFQIEMIR